MKSKRTLKVEKEIRQILGRFLINRYQGFLIGIVTISRVVVGGDLRHAKVYVSIMGDIEDQDENMIFLQERSGEMQKEISSSLPIKFCPKLQFYKDDLIEKSMKVDSMLDSLSRED